MRSAGCMLNVVTAKETNSSRKWSIDFSALFVVLAHCMGKGKSSGASLLPAVTVLVASSLPLPISDEKRLRL